MSIDLKPCPFCGGAPQSNVFIRDGRSVACRCGASVDAYSPNAEEKSIAAWNTRTVAEQPVSVSLESCARRLGELNYGGKWEEFFPQDSIRFMEDAKAVLDAAGVPYVD